MCYMDWLVKSYSSRLRAKRPQLPNLIHHSVQRGSVQMRPFWACSCSKELIILLPRLFSTPLSRAHTILGIMALMWKSSMLRLNLTQLLLEWMFIYNVFI